MRSPIASLLALIVLFWSGAAPAELTINNLTSFGGATTPVVQLTISSSTNDYNVCSAAQGTGVNPAVVAGGIVRVTLANGVVVGSTSTSTAGMVSGTCGSNWAQQWKIEVLVPSGTARIQGKGGAGGRGSEGTPGIDDTAGGGGGGGAGTQVGAGGASAVNAGNPGTATAGGTGGGGSPVGATSPTAAVSGAVGGPALQATAGTNSPNIELRPASGATLQVHGGGGGGGGGSGNNAGGNGGNPGQDGSAGAGPSPGSGGAHGPAYSTPGTGQILEMGPGTINDLGAWLDDESLPIAA